MIEWSRVSKDLEGKVGGRRKLRSIGFGRGGVLFFCVFGLGPVR